jgi:hypothetical protein
MNSLGPILFIVLGMAIALMLLTGYKVTVNNGTVTIAKASS